MCIINLLTILFNVNYFLRINLAVLCLQNKIYIFLRMFYDAYMGLKFQIISVQNDNHGQLFLKLFLFIFATLKIMDVF